jgi:hypothetical protein
MNRQEAKELLPIIQAFAEGKIIQIRKHGEEKYYDSTNSNLNFVLDHYDYRIKTEPKYRSFANAEECWQEMQKHQPFGWLKDKKDDHYILITAISNTDVDQVTSNGNISWMFCSISKFYTFADGTPFGIKEE